VFKVTGLGNYWYQKKKWYQR